MFKNWLEKKGPLIQAFSALVGLFVIVYWVIVGLGSLFFSSSDLEVTYSFGDAELPSSIGRKYVQVVDYLFEKPKADSSIVMLENIIDVSKYFNETRNKVTFHVQNTSDKTIKNIDIRIKNVKTLTAWGVGGNIIQSSESDEIMKKMNEDKSSGIILFSGIEKFAPQTNLKIIIWGDILEYSFDEPIIVTYDGGVAEIIKTSTISGFNSFIYTNSGFLVFIWILINISILLFVIDTYCRKKTQDAN